MTEQNARDGRRGQGRGGRLTIYFVVVAFLSVAIATVYFTHQSITSNEQQHIQIIRSEANEAATAIEQFIGSRQRLVEAFVLEKSILLSSLASDVENHVLRTKITESLERWFPNYFTFTIADSAGIDLIDDLDGFVGQACQLNIREFTAKHARQDMVLSSYETVIHPQARNYHFDVMAPWRTPELNILKGVFFVSFYPVGLQKIIKSHQGSGHHLVLVNSDRKYLIEISADGARDEISTKRGIRLTPDEIKEIKTSRPIAGSKWLLVGYIKPGHLDATARESWSHAVIVLILLTTAGGISIWKISRRNNEQRIAFVQLEQTNAALAEMADEQRVLREAAEAGERTKAQFLASMSHEIRTPLNAVIGLTDLVLKTDLTEHQRGYLTRVTIAGRNLLGLINDILDFSKIEAGKLTIETVEFEIDDVLSNLATVVSTKAEENANEVIITVDRQIPPRLIGDPLRVGQILINLVGNAAKFSENGEILIDVTSEKKGSAEWLVVSVKDTGIGMTSEQKAQLFKPFMQADQSISRTHGGTGLGLSISHQLVEAMGGTIGVDSKLGKGSTFHFRIPLVAAENSEARPHFEGIDPRAIRILLVDDNEVVRETLGRALRQLNFNVDVSDSGEDAVAQYVGVQGRPYDVVLMDWQLPGIDGIEATRRINDRSDKGTSPVIIMISSMDKDMISVDFRTVGIEYFVQKPINTSFLVDTLMSFFNEQYTRRPLHRKPDLESNPQAIGGNNKLLLAEDNELNQMVAVGVLKHAGFEVDVAENGKLALERLKDLGPSHYALVLMDIQMPEMDGLTATSLIREDATYNDLPVVAMTAHALDEERDRCLRAGMNDHVSKPIDARELISKINKWIQTGARNA